MVDEVVSIPVGPGVVLVERVSGGSAPGALLVQNHTC